MREKGHSLFTYYLIEGLSPNEKSINKDGCITPYTLGNYIYKSIRDLPPNKRPKQKPIIKAESSGEIILAYYPQLIKKEDVDISVLIYQGMVHLNNEDYVRALQRFDKATMVNPSSYVAYAYKGKSLLA